jgi:hypothetical protein
VDQALRRQAVSGAESENTDRSRNSLSRSPARERPARGRQIQGHRIGRHRAGLGLGYYGAWGDLALLEFRSTPSIGYAARSFGDSAGLARLLDTDVQFHLGEVFGKLGLSLGYNYRITIWDVKTTNVFGAIDDDFFKYRDDRHSFHLGLNW